jgi:o-succinylbenzoate synthase
MIITDLKYLEFTGTPLIPIFNSHFSIKHRTGIIIKLENEDGQTFYGEVSPLPRYSTESYVDAISCIRKVQNSLKIGGSTNAETLLNTASSVPSLVYGIESAIKGLSWQSNSLINNKIKVNSLVGIMNEADTINLVEQYIKNGINTLKLKIGRLEFDKDLKIINSITKKFPNIILRLDVNGVWDIEHAFAVIKKLSNFHIEYIEQPVSDLDDLIILSKNSSIPLAADESIQTNSDFYKVIESKTIQHIVIKPSMHGFDKTVNFINIANKANVKTIISSLFESPIGKAANIYLAIQCEESTAHGLMPEVDSKDFRVTHPYKYENGFLTLNYCNYFSTFKGNKEFI